MEIRTISMSANPIKWGSQFFFIPFLFIELTQNKNIEYTECDLRARMRESKQANQMEMTMSCMTMIKVIMNPYVFRFVAKWELEMDSMISTSKGGWIYTTLWCNAQSKYIYTHLKINKQECEKRKRIKNIPSKYTSKKSSI